MTLGQRISHCRKKLHISQEELGSRLGISRQAVSKWETGQSVPDMNNLLALAREFGVSVAELTETPEEAVPDTNDVENSPTPPSIFPHCRKSRLRRRSTASGIQGIRSSGCCKLQGFCRGIHQDGLQCGNRRNR